MRRLATIAAALLALGCTAYRIPAEQDNVEFAVRTTGDSAVLAALRQLESSGFSVVQQSPRTLLTVPRDIPESARGGASHSPTWTLRVQVMDGATPQDTRVRVSAYVVPINSATLDGNARRTLPVTGENRLLFGEVKQIADAIARRAWGRS